MPDTTNEPEPVVEPAIDIWGKCKNCEIRIGSHSIHDSVVCGIIKIEENTPIIYNKTTKKYEYKIN